METWFVCDHNCTRRVQLCSAIVYYARTKDGVSKYINRLFDSLHKSIQSMFFRTFLIAIVLAFQSANAQEGLGEMIGEMAGQATTQIIRNLPGAVDAANQVIGSVKAADIPTRIENKLRSLRQGIDQVFLGRASAHAGIRIQGGYNVKMAGHVGPNQYAPNAYASRAATAVATKAPCTTNQVLPIMTVERPTSTPCTTNQVLPIMTVERPSSTPCTTSTKMTVMPTLAPLPETTSCTTKTVTTTKDRPKAVPTGYPTATSSESATLLPVLQSTKTIGTIPSVTVTIDPKPILASGDMTLVPLSLGTIMTWVLLLA